MSASILVVDNEPLILKMLTCGLGDEYRVTVAGGGEEALARLDEQRFDLILTDMVMPGVDGLAVLNKTRSLNPRAPVVLMTTNTTDTTLDALRQRACDYIRKPFGLNELKSLMQRLLPPREVLCTPAFERADVQPQAGDHSIVGESAVIRAVREQIARSAQTPSNVLITGESGVGKELVARALHAASARSGGSFVPVNCGAIPEALLESQLFGHVRGAFTTAVQANPGLFAMARGGTLFLDEIGELPFPLQVKFLRVLEDRQVWPVGGTKPIPIHVRIIASTNRDLAHEIASGRFREDLFYRLNVVHIRLPSLRERRSDIPLLVEHLIERLNAKLGTRFAGVERDAMRMLVSQPWKGNVRELENFLERVMVLDGGDIITVRHVSAELSEPLPARPHNLRVAVRQFEREHLLQVLTEVDMDKREAARLLGISLASLYRKLGAEGPAAPTTDALPPYRRWRSAARPSGPLAFPPVVGPFSWPPAQQSSVSRAHPLRDVERPLWRVAESDADREGRFSPPVPFDTGGGS